MNPQPSTQIDQDVKNLVSAMGRAETGTSSPDAYKKRGASGEYGRYQFMPDTWRQWSQESGITTPLEQSTIEEQNMIAYNKVKQWKDQGLNPAQIASKWNSGDENAYKAAHVGTNAQGVAYNTPEHVRKVSQYYNEIKNGGQLGGTYTPPPPTRDFTPAAETGVETLTEQIGAGGGLASNLGGAFANIGTGTSDAFQKTVSGEINPLSGILQGAGAVAGGVGDVTDALIKSVPVVGGVYEKATDVLGKGFGGALEATGASKWMQENPEASGNIGAGLNMLSVLPFFKAFKSGARGLSDLKTGMTESKVIQQATDEIEGSLSKGTARNLDRAKGRGLDPVAILLDDPKLLPEIIEQNGKYIYDTKQGAMALQRSIDADELALQNLFANSLKQNVGINLVDVRKKVLSDLLPAGKINVNRTAISRELNRLFDDIAESAGRNFVSLSDLNDLKRQVRSGINFDAIDPTRALTRQVQFDVGQSLMKQVEDVAKKAGIKGVPEINKSMGGKLTALDIIEDLGGKTIKSGAKGKDGLIKSVGKTIPGVEGIIDYASRGVPTTATQRLLRRRPMQESVKGAAKQGLVGLGISGQLTGE